MTLSRTDQDWTVLLNEYNICKKKLESKREGLKILMKELEQANIEKDMHRNKIQQLQSELLDLKCILKGCWQDNSDGSLKIDFGGSEDKKIKSLSNLLQFSRDENLRLQHDLDNLRQLYGESQRDNQLLRASLFKYEAQKKVGLHDKQDKEKLIFQLEEALSKITLLEQELQIRRDEKKELDEERTKYRDKNSRLNTELNYILHNDDKRIVDIDALVLENQYLKEVVKQYKEEKSSALGTVARYKEALRQRQNSAARSKGRVTSRLSYLDLTSPTKKNHHEGFFSKSFDQKTVADLQRVNKAITEQLAEKDMALKHQRNTNRILGTRVSELEKKLKTLEISGLWSHEQRVPRNLPDASDLNAIQPINNAESPGVAKNQPISNAESPGVAKNQPISNAESPGVAKNDSNNNFDKDDLEYSSDKTSDIDVCDTLPEDTLVDTTVDRNNSNTDSAINANTVCDDKNSDIDVKTP